MFKLLFHFYCLFFSLVFFSFGLFFKKRIFWLGLLFRSFCALLDCGKTWKWSSKEKFIQF